MGKDEEFKDTINFKPLQVVQIKDVITVASLPNNGQSDLSDDEGLNINKVGFVEASTIDRATYIATSIAEMIRNKREPIHLLCYYNKLLQDESLEVIRVLASVDPESRGKLIKTLFLDIVRITHKEIVITKHEVSCTGIADFRVVLASDIFTFQKLLCELLRASDQGLQHV